MLFLHYLYILGLLDCWFLFYSGHSIQSNTQKQKLSDSKVKLEDRSIQGVWVWHNYIYT